MQRIYIKRQGKEAEHAPFDLAASTDTYAHLASLIGYTPECGNLAIEVDGGRKLDVLPKDEMTIVDGVYLAFSWDEG